jgi:hypothetical protein
VAPASVRLSSFGRLSVWFATRLLQFAVYLGIGWAVVGISGEQFLTNSPGAQLGFGNILVLPLTWLMSGMAWLALEGIGRIASWYPEARKATYLLAIFATAFDGLSYVVLYVYWLPNTIPVLMIAVIVAIFGSGVALWAHGYIRRPQAKSAEVSVAGSILRRPPNG